MRDTDYRVHITEGETAQDLATAVFVGTDWGTGNKPVLVWHEDSTHIVFKIPSGTHWVGLGMPNASHPGEFLVCTFIDGPGEYNNQGFRSVQVHSLFEMPLSERGRRSR